MTNKQYLEEKTAYAEAVLCRFLPKPQGYQKTVIDAMRYSVLAGGKRLRPILMLETYRMFGGKSPVVEPFMAAIEMIHTYSLVHDDLPAMDDDEYRRGKKTTHVQFGEAMGILAGDALLNYAFETACAAFALAPGEEAKVGRALALLGEKSGVYGMLGGQVVDVELTGRRIPERELDFIYDKKTGALLMASMQIGALLADASPDDIRRIGEVAACVGYAFQIRDDILDLTSTTETLGKPVGSDEKNEKSTYVSLHGLAEADRRVRELTDRALTRLLECPGDHAFLAWLLKELVQREK